MEPECREVAGGGPYTITVTSDFANGGNAGLVDIDPEAEGKQIRVKVFNDYNDFNGRIAFLSDSTTAAATNTVAFCVYIVSITLRAGIKAFILRLPLHDSLLL